MYPGAYNQLVSSWFVAYRTSSSCQKYVGLDGNMSGHCRCRSEEDLPAGKT